MSGVQVSGVRANQKLRTRKDLLEAAAALMKDGRTPTFDEVAERALVSRATAYRYFPGLDALLLEAALDVDVPTPDQVFGGDSSGKAAARLEKVDEALSAMMLANEAGLRVLLAQSLQRSPDGETPVRQNRRGALIAAALEPVKGRFDPERYELLTKALAALMGIEALVAFKDVQGLSDQEAARVRRWAMRALLTAARKD
jgi:AcrR family transcriptional regulator